MSRDPLLSVDRLSVTFRAQDEAVRAVRELSFSVAAGESLGLVGESGCGKTATALAILGLLPTAGRVTGGRVLFEGRDLLRLSRGQRRRLRGREIAMIFQDPSTSLNPVLTIGTQVAEAVQAHDKRISHRAARHRASGLLDQVGVPDPSARLRDLPHMWSGGMRQRVMIAMAIAHRPRVLVADEPTTALDVTIQAQVLDLLRQAQHETGAGLILITHDFGVVAEMADRVVVMYAGRAVEEGEAAPVFAEPHHPYTKAMLGSLPRLDHDLTRLDTIPGQPPSLSVQFLGCSFEPRCWLGHGRLRCQREEPALASANGSGHLAACHFQEEMVAR